MRPGGPSIGVFNASFALIVRTVHTSLHYRKPGGGGPRPYGKPF